MAIPGTTETSIMLKMAFITHELLRTCCFVNEAVNKGGVK
jgi:hypothetical protein